VVVLLIYNMTFTEKRNTRKSHGMYNIASNINHELI